MSWHPRAQEQMLAPMSHGPPSLPDRLVGRDRLTGLLDRAAALTLVVAPAGSGKTVLAAEWTRVAEASGLGVRWVSSADEEGLVTALLATAGLSQTALEELREPPDKAARIRLVTGALTSPRSSGGPATPIVIDDAHQLPLSGIQLLDAVLRAVPEVVRLVLLSRRDLPLPLVSLDLAGGLVTIRASQLGFDDEEATMLVRSHAPRATATDVEQLQEHTRGWAAALILAARTLDAAEDPVTAHLLMRSTEQPVLDYLLGESLDGLSEHTRQMLVSVCDEPEVTAQSVVILSGQEDAPERLTELARDGLLVTAYPAGAGGGLVWRLHPLLCEVLRRQASQGASGAMRDAHHRGAAFARSVGNAGEALRHAVLSEDEELLGTSLLELAPDLLAAGRVDLVDDHLRKLSPAYRSTHPHLLGIEALCRVQTGDVSDAAGLIARAELGESAATATTKTETTEAARDTAYELLAADLARLRLWKARLGWADLRPAIEAAHALLGSAEPSPLSITRRCGIALELGAAEAWQGDLEAASRRTQEVLVTARSLGHVQLTVTALGQCSLLDAAQGATQSAGAHASECLRLAVEGDLVDDVTARRALLAMAWADFQALDLAAATANLDRARPPSEPLDPLVVVLGQVLRARLLLEAGDLQVAERVLSAPIDVPTPVPAFALALVASTKAQVAAVTGDDVALAEEIIALLGLGCTTEAHLFSAIRTAFEGGVAEAVAALRELEDAHSPQQLVRSGVQVVRLTLLLLGGDADAARTALPHLLTTVATHRHLQVLTVGLRAREDFLGILREEVQRTDAHPFAAEALAAMESYDLNYRERRRPLLDGARGQSRGEARAPARARDAATVPRVATDLTPREFEVFEQLALGGSYSDIAGALFVTENTVKTHLASIYRKLGAERRAQALQVGRERGLLGSVTLPRPAAVSSPPLHG